MPGNLRDDVVEFVKMIRLTEMYSGLARKFDAILETSMPINTSINTAINIWARKKDKVNICSYNDAVIEELFDCSPHKNVYIHGINMKGLVMVIYFFDKLHRRPLPLRNSIAVLLDTLKAAYIANWFIRNNILRNELEEIEWVRDAEALIGPFIDSIKPGDEEPVINIDADEILVGEIYRRITGRAKYISLNVSIPTYIAQDVESHFTPIYSAYSKINFVKYIEVSGSNIGVHYINAEGKSRVVFIELDVASISKIHLLIDLEENYGTLRYISNMLIERIRRVSKALKIAEELAALIKIVS